ncbi:MAG: DeoR/GlpR family DNA-binding transcription regulator [Chryseosolibacter sp.]
MLQKERHQYVLGQIGLHKKVYTEALGRSLKVSADTIRRDLIELEKEGKLLRVHGGAISIDFQNPFQPTEVYAKKEKIQIAKKALTLIRDGMTLLAGGGTVMLELARLLPENLKGTLFTVSPLVALEVAQRSTMDVILLAGRLSRNSYICTGASVISQLSEIRADLCLMGTNGFSLKHGITDLDWEVVQVKKAMLKSAEKTALLCLSEKKDVVHKLQVCPFHAIHYLVTDRPAGEKQLIQYSRHCKVL